MDLVVERMKGVHLRYAQGTRVGQAIGMLLGCEQVRTTDILAVQASAHRCLQW